MPYPKPNESKSDYIARAIPAIMSDTGKDQKQAAGQAYGMWDAKKKRKTEGIDPSRAYPIKNKSASSISRYFEFKTDTGLIYKVAIHLYDIYSQRDDSPEVAEILFGIENLETGVFSFERSEVGFDEAGKILASVLKCIIQAMNDDPHILALTFDANKIEDLNHRNSRQRSYRTLAAVLARYLDWNYAVSSQNERFEKYYIVCPQLPEEAIEEILRRHEISNNYGLFSSAEPPVDKTLVDKLRGHRIPESFLTMDRVLLRDYGVADRSYLVSVYKNPDSNEVRKFIATGARGFVSKEGDLYLEGYEDDYLDVKLNPDKLSSVMHGPILEMIQMKEPEVIPDVEIAWSQAEYGITVQRIGKTNKIYIGESVDVTILEEKKNLIRQYLARAKKKNPQFDFFQDSIQDSGVLRLADFETDGLAGKLAEGIGTMYWKNGGPTRDQNDPGTFDDIETGTAGMALERGFDLNKREMTYSGPVVGDSLKTEKLTERKDYTALLAAMKDRRDPDDIEGFYGYLDWENLQGEHHKGPIVETDGNVAYVLCELCGELIPVEDGVPENAEELNSFFSSLEEDVGMSGDFQAHAPEHMIGINGVANLAHNKGTGNTKHGKTRDDEWDNAYKRTQSEDFLRVRESFLRERKNEFERLKKNRVNLTPEEHAVVMKQKAVWHNGPNGAENAAVWKSKDPKTGKVTYVTNTHRAYNTAPTLKGAIGRFHSFIKSTS